MTRFAGDKAVTPTEARPSNPGTRHRDGTVHEGVLAERYRTRFSIHFRSYEAISLRGLSQKTLFYGKNNTLEPQELPSFEWRSATKLKNYRNPKTEGDQSPERTRTHQNTPKTRDVRPTETCPPPTNEPTESLSLTENR